MMVFGMINWTFTWLKPDGRMGYREFAEQVVGMVDHGLQTQGLARNDCARSNLRRNDVACIVRHQLHERWRMHIYFFFIIIYIKIGRKYFRIDMASNRYTGFP
jgi:hypothetical protein